MKNRYSLTIIAVVGTIGLTAWVTERKRQEQAFVDLQREHAESLTDLRRRVDVLALAKDHPYKEGQWSLVPPEEGVRVRPAANPPSHEGNEADAAGQKSEMRTPEERRAEVHLQYENAFAEDGSDREWAAAAQRVARDKLPSALPDGSTLRSFECHTTMCRLETVHKDRLSYSKFVEMAFVDPASRLWNGATYSTPLNDGPDDGMMVTFIAREEHPLPQFIE